MTIRRVVVDHVLLVVRDPEASRRFYRAASAPLGIVELKTESDGVAFSTEGMDDFAVFTGRHPTTKPMWPSTVGGWRCGVSLTSRR
jgi:catechol 2,3-dioxygenase-like lactoylglutathione lyase family enzyme